MAVSKVVYSGNVLVDLTADTVTAANLKKGITAHNNSGEIIVGTLESSDTDTILTYGFADGNYSYADDGTVTSVNSEGQKLVRSFSADGLTCKTVLYDTDGEKVASMTKTYNNDCTEVTITDSNGVVTTKQLKM